MHIGRPDKPGATWADVGRRGHQGAQHRQPAANPAASLTALNGLPRPIRQRFFQKIAGSLLAVGGGAGDNGTLWYRRPRIEVVIWGQSSVVVTASPPMSKESVSCDLDAGDRAAVVLLREQVKRRFPAGALELRDQVGYCALVHAAWRISQAHAIYPNNERFWPWSHRQKPAWRAAAATGPGGPPHSSRKACFTGCSGRGQRRAGRNRGARAA